MQWLCDRALDKVVSFVFSRPPCWQSMWSHLAYRIVRPRGCLQSGSPIRAEIPPEVTPVGNYKETRRQKYCPYPFGWRQKLRQIFLSPKRCSLHFWRLGTSPPPSPSLRLTGTHLQVTPVEDMGKSHRNAGGQARPPVEAHDKNCDSCAGQLSAVVGVVLVHGRTLRNRSLCLVS